MTRWLRYVPLWCYPLLFFATVAIGNDFYTHGSFPTASSPATSASMRAEFDLISAGFDKMPVLTGNNNKIVVVNSGATGLTTTGALSIAGGLTITGNYATTMIAVAPVTLTLPSLTGTLATTNAIETFTNKTLNLGSNTITGTIAQFNAALSDDEFATLNAAQVLTNKELQGGTISNATILDSGINGLTSVNATIFGTYTLGGSPTITGATITAPTITTPTLTSPTITGNGGGALVLIDAKTAANNVAIDFASGISSTYDEYRVVVVDLIPANDGVDLWFRVSQDNGASFLAGATDYVHGRQLWNNSAVAANAGSGAGDTKLLLSANVSNASTRAFAGVVTVFNPSGTVKAKYCQWQLTHTDQAGNLNGLTGNGTFKVNTGAINGLRFLMSSGNITSGKFYLYGVRKG